MTARWSIQTPQGAAALAVVQVTAPSGPELDGALAAAGIAPVPVGAVRLRDLAGADRGVVARWSPGCAHLYPHAGPAVLRRLAEGLERAGLERRAAADPRLDYPEAADEVEARTLAALARAASPLAIDLLLDQPARWRRGRAPSPWSDVLNRLIDPPLVVALGPPNIGKSTLVNALAGRGVSIVADEPGTTLDHVGVMLDLAGLVVRWVDTPGLGRAGAPHEEREAVEIALAAAARADLLVLCADAPGPPPSPPPIGAPAVRLALRRDLGAPAWPADAEVSALRGEGLAAAVRLIRDRLVPEEARRCGGAWRFW